MQDDNEKGGLDVTGVYIPWYDAERKVVLDGQGWLIDSPITLQELRGFLPATVEDLASEVDRLGFPFDGNSKLTPQQAVVLSEIFLRGVPVQTPPPVDEIDALCRKHGRMSS